MVFTGEGRLLNTRPSDPTQALALDLVGGYLKARVEGGSTTSMQDWIKQELPKVTVQTEKGETNSIPQILSSGHFDANGLGFTGSAPKAEVVRAQYELGLTVVAGNSASSTERVFGQKARTEFIGVTATEEIKVPTPNNGEFTRVVIADPEVSRELYAKHIVDNIAEGTTVYIINNDLNAPVEQQVKTLTKIGGVIVEGHIKPVNEKTPKTVFEEAHSSKTRGADKAIVVYTLGSERATDIEGVFTVNDPKHLITGAPKTTAEGLVTRQGTKPEQVVQGVGRFREDGDVTVWVNDAPETGNIARNRAESIYSGESGKAETTNVLATGYDSLVKNTIDHLAQLDRETTLWEKITGKKPVADTADAESLFSKWKRSYESEANSHTDAGWANQTGKDLIAQAAARSRAFLDALGNSPEFSKLSSKARDYYDRSQKSDSRGS